MLISTISLVTVLLIPALVTAQTAFKVEIGEIDSIARGSEVSIPVLKSAGSEKMYHFEFVIAFDRAASEFIDATPGEIFDETGDYQWEQFEVRLDSFIYPAYDSIHAPAKLYFIDVSGIADVENGAHVPLTYQIPDSTVLFYLNFHVSYNIRFTCNLLPIRFLWEDCGDNMMEYGGGGGQIAVSRFVYDIGDYEITNPWWNAFPLYSGFPDACFDSSAFGLETPIRFVDYHHGSISVSCDSSNPLKGDLNLNGLAYEVADAALFAGYLIEGSSVFAVSRDSQMTASDISGDLMPGQVNDYVYLGGIIAGDLTPGQIITTSKSGILLPEEVGSTLKLRGSFEIPVAGMALSLYATNATPYTVTLLPAAADMDLAYEKSGDTLRILIHNDVSGGGPRQAIDSGFSEFLLIEFGGARPRLITASAAGMNGEMVVLPPIEETDSRGDINLNGIANELADFVLFRDYFLNGPQVFGINTTFQIEASDMNADGLALTIEDLVYLERVLEGILPPIPKPVFVPEGEITTRHTDTSIVISGSFSDSAGGIYFRFYAPDTGFINAYRVYWRGSVVDTLPRLGYATGDSILSILVVTTPGLSRAALQAGAGDILEIAYDGAEPQMVHASAATFLAQRITLSLGSGSNTPPVFESYSTTLTNDYYGGFYLDFDAVDQLPLPDEIFYQIITGPGEIDLLTGVWKYAPMCENMGTSFTLIVCAADYLHPCPQSDGGLHAMVAVQVLLPPTLVGDANGSGVVELTDVVYLVAYLYKGGEPPLPVSEVGDVNGSGELNILDITHLIAYMYKNGPAPECP